MPRTRRCHRLMFRRVTSLDRKLLFPILPVAVHDFNGNRRADGLAMPHATENMGFIRLDLHTTATPIPLLAPPKLAVNEFEIDRHTGRQP